MIHREIDAIKLKYKKCSFIFFFFSNVQNPEHAWEDKWWGPRTGTTMKRVYKEQGMEDVAGARRVSYSGRGVAGSHRLCLKGQGTISPSPSSISLLSFFYYLAFVYLSGSFFSLSTLKITVWFLLIHEGENWGGRTRGLYLNIGSPGFSGA